MTTNENKRFLLNVFRLPIILVLCGMVWISRRASGMGGPILAHPLPLSSRLSFIKKVQAVPESNEGLLLSTAC